MNASWNGRHSRCRLRGWIASSAGIAAARGHRDGEIHEAESVFAQSSLRDRMSMPSRIRWRRRFHVGDEPLRGLAPPRR